MKFRFKGTGTLLVDTLTTNQIYNIIQFQKTEKYLIVYVIDNENKVIYIPYISIGEFNIEWEYIDEESD